MTTCMYKSGKYMFTIYVMKWVRSLVNLNCRAGIIPNVSDFPEVKQPAGIGARTQNQTSLLPTLLAEADLEKKASGDHVTILCQDSVTQWGGLGSGTCFQRRVWTKSAPSQFFLLATALALICVSHTISQLSSVTFFLEECPMQHGTLHCGEIWLDWEPSWGAEPQRETRFRCINLADL